MGLALERWMLGRLGCLVRLKHDYRIRGGGGHIYLHCHRCGTRTPGLIQPPPLFHQRLTDAAPRPTEVVVGEATAAAGRPFTGLDQVMQLVKASEADPDTGFMARLLALCSLPRTNPGNRDKYVRRNGPYTLVMTATGTAKLPYGSLPRLLLAYVSTEAVRTQSRVIVFEDSLSAFMRALGVFDTGGRTQSRLRNQMDRLFSASVSLTYEDEQSKRFMTSPIATRGEFWWNPKWPDDRSLWESKIELGNEFFEEVTHNPVPIDMHILKAMKRSSLGLDLYLWLTYRTFGLKRPLRLTWPMLYRQFGADPSKASDRVTVDNFRKDCLRELAKIQTAWRTLNCTTAKGALLVGPSHPRIPPRLVE